MFELIIYSAAKQRTCLTSSQKAMMSSQRESHGELPLCLTLANSVICALDGICQGAYYRLEQKLYISNKVSYISYISKGKSLTYPHEKLIMKIQGWQINFDGVTGHPWCLQVTSGCPTFSPHLAKDMLNIVLAGAVTSTLCKSDSLSVRPQSTVELLTELVLVPVTQRVFFSYSCCN